MKVSIIILNWNGGEQDCVESIESALSQDFTNKEIIFVDNGSSDGSYESVMARFPDLIYVQTGSNKGCPEGRNIGAKQASGDVIVFLENDGEWKETDVVSQAIDFMLENKNIGAMYTAVEGYQSEILDPPVDTNNSGVESVQFSSTFRGGASFIYRNIFEKTGGFPSDFLRQGEEVFISYQIIDRGYDIVYWPQRTLRHKGSDYTGKSDAVMNYNYINDLKTITRLFPFFYYLIYIVGKIGINMPRFIKKGKFLVFLKLTAQGVIDVKNRHIYTKISVKGLKKFNSIKYNKDKKID